MISENYPLFRTYDRMFGQFIRTEADLFAGADKKGLPERDAEQPEYF